MNRNKIRAGIANAIQELKIADNEWRELSEPEAYDLYCTLEKKFTSETGRRWWWEVYSRPFSKKTFKDDNGYGYEYFIADKKEEWLIAENHSSVIYAVGETVCGRLKELQ